MPAFMFHYSFNPVTFVKQRYCVNRPGISKYNLSPGLLTSRIEHMAEQNRTQNSVRVIRSHYIEVYLVQVSMEELNLTAELYV